MVSFIRRKCFKNFVKKVIVAKGSKAQGTSQIPLGQSGWRSLSLGALGMTTGRRYLNFNTFYSMCSEFKPVLAAKSDREALLKKVMVNVRKNSTDGLYFKPSGHQAIFKGTEGYLY